MLQIPDRLWARVPVIAGLLLFMAAGLVGGPENVHDVAAIHALAAERAAHELTWRAIMITEVGGAAALTAILLISVALLAYRRQWRLAISLAGVVLGGRIAVELLKIFINRPRPHFGPFPVDVVSLSFPSGHAANSMITFLTLALVVATGRYRAAAIAGAIMASALIGSTRPLLGVHWPSDVVGGWAFGIAWVVGGVELSRRWRGAAK